MKNGVIDIGFPYDEIKTLTFSHRGTLETMKFANALLQDSEGYKDLTEKVSNRGEKPMIYHVSMKYLIQIVRKTREKYPNSNILVATVNEERQRNIYEELSEELEVSLGLGESWDFEKRVFVSTYQGVKGLEFDFVFLFDIETFLENVTENSKNILYTVVTRAKKRFILFREAHSPHLDKLLEKIPKELYEMQNIR